MHISIKVTHTYMHLDICVYVHVNKQIYINTQCFVLNFAIYICVYIFAIYMIVLRSTDSSVSAF